MWPALDVVTHVLSVMMKINLSHMFHDPSPSSPEQTKSSLTSSRKEQAHPSCHCHCHLHPWSHSVHRLTKRDLRGRKSMEELGYRLINSLINRNSNQFTELTALVIGLYKWRGKREKNPDDGDKSSSKGRVASKATPVASNHCCLNLYGILSSWGMICRRKRKCYFFN